MPHNSLDVKMGPAAHKRLLPKKLVPLLPLTHLQLLSAITFLLQAVTARSGLLINSLCMPFITWLSNFFFKMKIHFQNVDFFHITGV